MTFSKSKIDNLILESKKRLTHYSPYSFYRGRNVERIFDHSVRLKILSAFEDEEVTKKVFVVDQQEHLFIIRYLKWDSDYFKVPTFKIEAVLYGHSDFEVLSEAFRMFHKDFFSGDSKYCFAELPSEDIVLLQAFGEVRFKLIETRATYYMSSLKDFNQPRFKTRKGALEDIPNLKRVAREMRNDYDRMHADQAFDSRMADEYLATYIEESLKGFSDVTMVPDETDSSPDAFLTADYQKDQWESLGTKFSKMVLSAVCSKKCRGWYRKLISEMTYHLRDEGAECIFMHPSTSNRSVIHTYETLGYKFGRSSHILSFKS